MAKPRLGRWLGRLGCFSRAVLKKFIANKGLLLAGGVGYNALLSLIPLFIILLATLSYFYTQEEILHVVGVEMRFIVPFQPELITGVVEAFLSQSRVLNIVILAVLLFFSSLAFRMFEDAVDVIFKHLPQRRRRSFWVSALLPYLFIMIIFFGLLFLTGLTTMLAAAADLQEELAGYSTSFSGLVLSLFGYGGVIVMFSLLYKVTPNITISWSRAFSGGVVAATLWEGVRHVVVWYLENVSMVNTVYGSTSAIIVILLLMEIGAVIVLLGAQCIARLEYNAAHGRPWYSGDLIETEDGG